MLVDIFTAINLASYAMFNIVNLVLYSTVGTLACIFLYKGIRLIDDFRSILKSVTPQAQGIAHDIQRARATFRAGLRRIRKIL